MWKTCTLWLRGNSQLLIKSFLSRCQQYISINGFDSSKFDIHCGVPHGSTLGPLWFALKGSIASHFAILYASNMLKSIETILNCDLKSTSEWLIANRLSLNLDKSKLIFKPKQRKLNNVSISINLGGVRLIPSDNVKYLRLHLAKYLSLNIKINQLSEKLSWANGIISKLRHFVTKQTFISVYYSLFYSHLLYGCPHNLYIGEIKMKIKIRSKQHKDNVEK